MGNLAERLMSPGQGARPNIPTAIFGTAGTVRHSLQEQIAPVRIGLWPVRSVDKPEIAMGIAVLLGYLLARYRGVRVYHIMAQVDGEPETYSWTLAHSQFDVDDWQLEDLDDNVGVWGTFDDRTLTLFVENDLLTGEQENEPKQLTYTASDLTEVVNILPRVVSDIADLLEVSETRFIMPLYPAGSWDSSLLAEGLKQSFHWERKLYLSLWGQAWPEAQLLTDADRLLETGAKLGALGAWLVSQALARVIALADLSTKDVAVSLVEKVIRVFEDSPIPPVVLAAALLDAQMPEAAYRILGAALEDAESEEALLYLGAAEVYRRGGRVADMVNTLQTAIEKEIADPRLYQLYADLLVSLDYSGVGVEAVVFVDPDEQPDNTLLWEAVEAYQAALDLAPDDDNILSRQLLQLIDLEAEKTRIQQTFEQLVRVDHSGEQVRTVIDAMYNLPDVSFVYDILESAIAANPDRVDLYLNLAAIHALDEDGEGAVTILDKVRHLTDDEAVISKIERLRLIAQDPEFEARLGEIADILNAGNPLNTDDAEFLEAVLEKVPGYTEASILLAKAYIGWDEISSGIETLLDAHKHEPDDPEVIALLCETLWQAGEEDLAFSYLKKGLAANPSHVPLLALAGQFLFEDNQIEAAKAYLAQAEAISPRDPALDRVRQHIGRSLNP